MFIFSFTDCVSLMEFKQSFPTLSHEDMLASQILLLGSLSFFLQYSHQQFLQERPVGSIQFVRKHYVSPDKCFLSVLLGYFPTVFYNFLYYSIIFQLPLLLLRGQLSVALLLFWGNLPLVSGCFGSLLSLVFCSLCKLYNVLKCGCLCINFAWY